MVHRRYSATHVTASGPNMPASSAVVHSAAQPACTMAVLALQMRSSCQSVHVTRGASWRSARMPAP
eukprot:15442558-Alexandrium_andersonii.AAC.1